VRMQIESFFESIDTDRSGTVSVEECQTLMQDAAAMAELVGIIKEVSSSSVWSDAPEKTLRTVVEDLSYPGPDGSHSFTLDSFLEYLVTGESPASEHSLMRVMHKVSELEAGLKSGGGNVAIRKVETPDGAFDAAPVAQLTGVHDQSQLQTVLRRIDEIKGAVQNMQQRVQTTDLNIELFQKTADTRYDHLLRALETHARATDARQDKMQRSLDEQARASKDAAEINDGVVGLLESLLAEVKIAHSQQDIPSSRSSGSQRTAFTNRSVKVASRPPEWTDAGTPWRHNNSQPH